MNKRKTLTLLLILFSVVQAFAQTNFNQVAEGMTQGLIKHFWGANFPGYEQRYYFNYGSDLSNMTTINYWPEAHAMDVIVDAYQRTGDKTYLDFYPLWWKGMPAHHQSANPKDPWWAEYIDDMEWIVLAQIRMFETTGNTMYIEKARQMYDDWIWPTWGPEDEAPWYGGITWNVNVEKTKNACSNGPAAIIAAKLYTNYKKAGFKGGKSRKTYLKEAKAIYKWLRDNLYDEQTGGIYDNMNRQGKISRATFTYNSGTFIGAADWLYRITGKQQYMTEAKHAADFVINNLSDNNSVLSDAPNGDGGLFHGIFFRYFAQLINNPKLDTYSRSKYANYLTKCAEVMAEHGINKNTMLYGGRWFKAPADDEPVCLTAHLTGCMLMEAACAIQKQK